MTPDKFKHKIFVIKFDELRGVFLETYFNSKSIKLYNVSEVIILNL